MSADRAPSSYFPGIGLLAQGDQAPAKSLAIPLTALPELSDAECDASAGDAFEIIRAIIDAFHKAYRLAEKSSHLRAHKSSSVEWVRSGAAEQEHIVHTYTLSFDTIAGDVNVAPET